VPEVGPGASSPHFGALAIAAWRGPRRGTDLSEQLSEASMNGPVGDGGRERGWRLSVGERAALQRPGPYEDGRWPRRRDQREPATDSLFLQLGEYLVELIRGAPPPPVRSQDARAAVEALQAAYSEKRGAKWPTDWANWGSRPGSRALIRAARQPRPPLPPRRSSGRRHRVRARARREATSSRRMDCARGNGALDAREAVAHRAPDVHGYGSRRSPSAPNASCWPPAETSTQSARRIAGSATFYRARGPRSCGWPATASPTPRSAPAAHQAQDRARAYKLHKSTSPELGVKLRDQQAKSVLLR